MPWKYNNIQKDIIAKICVDADLSNIASTCKYPNWLGYLGLVVHYMQSNSNAYKKLSQGWASQLIEIASDCKHRLDDVKQGKLLMKIEDIQHCEHYVSEYNKWNRG